MSHKLTSGTFCGVVNLLLLYSEIHRRSEGGRGDLQREIPCVTVGKTYSRDTHESKYGLGLGGIQQVSVGHPIRRGVEGGDSQV